MLFAKKKLKNRKKELITSSPCSVSFPHPPSLFTSSHAQNSRMIIIVFNCSSGDCNDDGLGIYELRRTIDLTKGQLILFYLI